MEDKKVGLQFDLKALTDIWTGDVEGKPDKLRLTGIKGSIRWWSEVIVRGLGGYACNPGGKDKENKCLLDPKDVKKAKDSATLQNLIKVKTCPVCQLFGCTGWSAKFRMEAEKKGNDEEEYFTGQIKASKTFRLKFIPLKPFSKEEEGLLNATIKLIVEYGALGGRTALKPSEPPPAKHATNNSKAHHRDYGVLGYATAADEICVQIKPKFASIPDKVNHDDWPDLRHFWFVKDKHLDRGQINTVVKRQSGAPQNYEALATEIDVFHGGYIKERGQRKGVPNGVNAEIDKRKTESSCESKKIFSFHGQIGHGQRGHGQRGMQSACFVADVRRCFGYTREGKLDGLIKLIKELNGDDGTPIFNNGDIKTGETVLDKLFANSPNGASNGQR